MRRHAKRVFERACEMRLGRTAHACQPRHWPFLVRSRVHPIFRAQQATQQIGVTWRGGGVVAHGLPHAARRCDSECSTITLKAMKG
jgi:hypothetical protein